MPQDPSSFRESDPILPSRQASLDPGRRKSIIKDYGSRDPDCSGDPPPPGPSSCLQRSLGLLLAFLSGVLLTTFSALLKMVTMDPMQVVVIRGGLQTIIMGCVAMYKNQSFKGDTFCSYD